ncbi:MAG: hypothetical protein AB1725_10250 [Armatimonadota bacterium]
MSKTWLVGTFAVGAIGAATIVALALLRPKTLDGTASAVMEAILNNDPESVYEFAHECQKAELSRENFVAAWQEIVTPVLRSFKPLGQPKVEVSPGGLQAVASVKLRNEQGVEYDLYVVIWPTDDGPRHDLLAPFTTVWCIRWVVEQGSEDLSLSKACAVGLAADAPTLRRAGIHALPSANPERGAVPIDECIAYLRKSAQDTAVVRRTGS